jgi:hypothetical protein
MYVENQISLNRTIIGLKDGQHAICNAAVRMRFLIELLLD